MGYYTFYSLSVKNADADSYAKLTNRLIEKELVGNVFDHPCPYRQNQNVIFTSYEERKWYDCKEDMIKISEEFPQLVFELEGDGEDKEDYWRAYFHNGDCEECSGNIVYEKPMHIPWDE